MECRGAARRCGQLRLHTRELLSDLTSSLPSPAIHLAAELVGLRGEYLCQEDALRQTGPHCTTFSSRLSLLSTGTLSSPKASTSTMPMVSFSASSYFLLVLTLVCRYLSLYSLLVSGILHASLPLLRHLCLPQPRLHSRLPCSPVPALDPSLLYSLCRSSSASLHQRLSLASQLCRIIYKASLQE